MTAIRACRVGTLPRPSTRPAADSPLTLGPDLPGATCAHKIHELGPVWDDRVAGEIAERREERHEQAIAVCWTCPVRADCLAARLADPSLGEGVWGGQVFSSGRTCRCGAPIPAEAHPQQVHCTEACRNTRRGHGTATRTGNCDYCDGEFTTNSPSRRYCDDTCQRRGYVQAGAPPVRFPRLDRCQGCGGDLPPGQRRNCSKRCRNRASERRGRYRTAA